jgi:hypothetical protein
MNRLNRSYRQLVAAVGAACAGLAFASAAGAVDLRDWSRQLPAVQRFVVLEQFDGRAVLDKETQLVWERFPTNADMFQSTASHWCINARIGGRMGWRLPTIVELASLVDPDATGTVKLPEGHPIRTADGHPLPQTHMWWSSTFDRRAPVDPTIPGSYRYYSLRIGTAEPAIENAQLQRNAICVRGPGSSGET